MKSQKITFGTYNIPLDNTFETASFSAPGILPKEVFGETSFSEIREMKDNESDLSTNGFDKNLKALLKVPNPKS